MISLAQVEHLLAPDRTLRPAAGRVLTALRAGQAGAPYDRHASHYDRLIGSRAYNRLVWGASPAAYRAFAAEAVGSGNGPYLDAGCGTAVFTAGVYRDAARPLVLTDLSLQMLGRAAERLPDVPAALVQADLLDLPFAPGSFETVGCFAMLHVLEDPWPALAALREQLRPGGRLFASMLVSDRPVGGPYLRMLHRVGEVGRPRGAHELAAAAHELFGSSAQVSRSGSMAWLRVNPSAGG